MDKIGYKRGVSDLATYIDAERFKDGDMMLERVDRLLFEKFNPNITFADWKKGRIFTKTDELKWLERSDGFHLVMITENDLPSDFQVFRNNLQQVLDEKGNPRRDRQVYLWGKKEFDSQNQPRWYEGRIPEMLDYPLDGKENPYTKHVVLKVREYDIEEQDPDGRPFTSIIHRYVGLEEK